MDNLATKLKLLVIDDDDVDRMQLKRALVNSGFKYEIFEYAIANSIPDFNYLRDFDCIFLDYLLPGDNGLLLVKKIRDNGIKTPVVIITSQGNESIAVELMKAGASDYVVKNDINGQSLAKVLRNMLAMRRMVEAREEAEEALRVSESRLAEAQSIAKTGNWEFSADSNSFFLSAEAYKIFGIQRGFDPTVENLLNCLHEEDREMVRKAWNENLEGKPLNIDFRVVVTPDASKFVTSRGYAICDNSGILKKIIGTVQDITERKLAEKEILEARELAENSIKVREVFLANMSHEIRTPMNAILGFTDLLYETSLTPEQKKFLDAIHFSGENLLVVINDILDLSKIHSGKMSVEKCDFILSELIASVVTTMSAKAEEKGLRLTYSIDQHLPQVIKGDPVRLNQVLINLISNAVKFTEEGSVSLKINANTAENRNILIEFSVSDTGIGIPEDKHALIFDKFIQASDDTTRKYGGSGLGLTIVKSLVELQGGKISLDSKPGLGSTFKVQLPFEQANARTGNQPRKALPAKELESLKDTVVLVAEDNAVNQLLIKKVLDKAGCKADIASNGIEALAFLRSKRYDIVLMDIQMPGMDGYEATCQIRREFPEPVSHIPIIAMTAHAFGSDVTRCMSAGMNDYISKPFKAVDLYEKIMKYAVHPAETKVISLNPLDANHKIDLSAISELGKDDVEFINELVQVFDKQTPAFIEKLRAYTKSRNYEAIRSLCHQIKSSYGILKISDLDEALREISLALDGEKTGTGFAAISNLINRIIFLISAGNDKVQNSLKKTG